MENLQSFRIPQDANLNMSLQQAYQNLVLASRKLQTDAETHDILKKSAEVVGLALEELERRIILSTEQREKPEI